MLHVRIVPLGARAVVPVHLGLERGGGHGLRLLDVDRRFLDDDRRRRVDVRRVVVVGRRVIVVRIHERGSDADANEDPRAPDPTRTDMPMATAMTVVTTVGRGEARDPDPQHESDDECHEGGAQFFHGPTPSTRLDSVLFTIPLPPLLRPGVLGIPGERGSAPKPQANAPDTAGATHAHIQNYGVRGLVDDCLRTAAAPLLAVSRLVVQSSPANTMIGAS